jgi:hypothetical protein
MTGVFKTFTVPIPSDGAAEDELNRFIRSSRVVAIQVKLVERGGEPVYTFLVEYADQDGPEPGAYGDGGNARRRNPNTEEVAESIESKPRREAFRRAVHVRKGLAARDKVNAYAVMTNAQLKALVLMDGPGPAGLKKISGVGDETVAKYGAAILAALAGAGAEARGTRRTERRRTWRPCDNLDDRAWLGPRATRRELEQWRFELPFGAS